MIRGLGRLLLLRYLPRRLLPVLTAWEIVQLVRGLRRARMAAPPDDPRPASTARPGPAARRPPPR